jgi:hypothetical protein
MKDDKLIITEEMVEKGMTYTNEYLYKQLQKELREMVVEEIELWLSNRERKRKTNLANTL